MTINTLPQSNQITQFDLTRYVTIANQIETLKAEQSALEYQLTTALANGAEVESGTHRANLKTTERRNVSWRSVVERLKGEGYARRVLSATKPKQYTKLIVN